MRVFRVAVDADEATLLALCRSVGVVIQQRPSIVFVAEEDGAIQAAMGLDYSTGLAVAGPWVVAPDARHKYFLILRLIEFMELFLARAGVSTYRFYIHKRNKRWLRIVRHAGAALITRDKDRLWFVRKVNTYGTTEYSVPAADARGAGANQPADATASAAEPDTPAGVAAAASDVPPAVRDNGSRATV